MSKALKSLIFKLARLMLLSLLGLIAGCGDSDWASVTGTVSINGVPAGPGTILFEPMAPVSAVAPSGIGNFGENGQYVVRSAGGRQGIPPGEYLVMIDGKSKESSGDEYVDPNQTSKIPAKYLNAKVSGLKASLTAGDNTVNFDLKP
jgi:hypothetical protein